MAQKRMFSLKIVDTDAFLDMPLSSQALYFHLAMRADDDGFVSNPKKISKVLGTQDDDLKVLLSKRFILPFESGVCVIKHWRIHNYIAKDRYNQTNYVKEKKQLKIKSNSSYTECIQLDDTDKIRLDKISKDKIAEETSAPFSLKDEIKKLEDNSRREMNVIALYFEERKPDLQNKEQYQIALKRHLRAAKQLKPFTDNQILNGVKKAKFQTPEWTLETVVKMLTK